MDDKFVEHEGFIKCQGCDSILESESTSMSKEWKEAKENFKATHTETCWRKS